MNNILTAIGQFSKQVQHKIIQVVKEHLPAQELSLLRSFFAGNVLKPEQLQQLNSTLDAVFKTSVVQHFLNNEQEGGQSIGQVVLGNNFAIATGYGTAISGVARDVNITHNHIGKPVPRVLTTAPQVDTKQVIGRGADVEKIKDLLKVSDKVLLMNGLGGIGKTTVAKVFLKEHDTAFQHIAWLDVTGGNVKEAFVANQQLVDSLHLRETIDTLERNKDYIENAFSIIINRMRKLERKGDAPYNLLIIDNAQEDIEHSKTLDYIALKPDWKVLVTSREDLLGFEKYTLGLLSPEDAKALFYLHYSYKLDEQANAEALIEEILELIDYHTLSIELVSKTAQARRLKLDKVLEHLKKKGLAILKDEGDNSYIQFLRNFNQRERKVYAFLLSIFELAGLSKSEQWTAKQFAVMPSIPIRLEDRDEQNLTHLLQIEEGEQRDTFIDSLNDLQKGGWLTHTKEEDAFKMHNLVQEIMREKLKPRYEDCEKLCKNLISLLDIDQTKDNPVDKLQWIPFGQHLLNYLNKFLIDKKVHLINNLGLVYRESGNISQAKNLLEEALKYSKITKKHIAKAKANLAIVYQDLGEYGKAQTILQEALDDDLIHLGENNVEVAEKRSNLATLYQKLSKLNKAKVLIESSLSFYLQGFGEDDIRTARTRVNLATIQQSLGNHKKAIELLQQSLKTMQHKLGGEHAEIASVKLNLAQSHKQLGNLFVAQNLLKESLEDAENNLEANHPILSIRKNSLAGVYYELGQLDKARQLIEEALAIAIENFGDSHPSVFNRQGNLALIYQELGEYEKARQIQESILPKASQMFDQKHLLFTQTQSNLAMTLIGLEEYTKAEELLYQSMNTEIETLGKHHPSVLRKKMNLGLLYQKQGKLEIAVQYISAVYTQRKIRLGENHPKTKKALEKLKELREQLNTP